MKPLREKLEAIFEAAAALETDAQRQEYLDRACPDLELRQEVESLLAAMKDPDTLFETKDDAGTPDLESIPILEQPGTQIGRYKLLQKVGIGGMGVVYMAEQTEPVKRKVALKIIKLGMDTRQVVARFEAERQALAMMDHPNIAKVLDAGATDTGRPYFVMELVRGVPITEYCDKNKLSTKQRLDLFMDVCRAIHHAHQKGIIHRDIKPSNVMVTLHDGNPVAKVIDFGIAKATNHNLTEKTLFTNYSQMIGTPAYMSPEQAEMSGLDVDTRTDVYSLGVLLYELLTSTTPFPSQELLSLGYGEMQRVITQEEPPKPSTRLSTMQNEQKTVVANNRAIPKAKISDTLKGDLDWIVMKALEKDRTQRYETVNGLVMDVTRFLKDEPVTAAAPTLRYQLRKFYRRNQRFVQSAVTVSILLLLATVISLNLARRAAVMRDIANRALYQEAEARKEAEQLREQEEHAKTNTEKLLRESLLGQSEAWLASQTPGYQTNVLNALKQARQLPGAEDDIARMRSLALGALAEPNKELWKNHGNVVPDAADLTSIAYSADSLAFGYRNGNIKIIALETGETVQDITTSSGHPILALKYHEKQNAWIACNSRGMVSLWSSGLGDRTEQTLYQVKLDPQDDTLELLTSEEGVLLFSYLQSKIWLWQSIDGPAPPKETNLPLSIPKNDFTKIQMAINLIKQTPIALHPNGRYLAYAPLSTDQESRYLAIWDLDKQTNLQTLFEDNKIDPNMVFGLTFSKDGRVLGSAFGRQVYSIRTERWTQFSRHHTAGAASSSEYTFSPSGKIIAVGGPRLEVWNIGTGDRRFTSYLYGGMPVFRKRNELITIRVSHELRRPDNRLRWDASCFRIANSPYLSTLQSKASSPSGASFSPDSKTIGISGSNSLTVTDLNTLTPREFNEERGGNLDFKAFFEDPAYSSNGSLLAAHYKSNSEEFGIRFWNVRTGETLNSLKFGDALGFVAFSPSQPIVAAVSGNHLGIWKYHALNDANPPATHLSLEPVIQQSLEQEGQWLTFHPTLNHLAWAEGSPDMTQPKVRILDLNSGEELPFEKAITSSHYSATFLPKGTQIALSANVSGHGKPWCSIQIWDYSNNQLISQGIADLESTNNSWGLRGLSSSKDGRFLSFRSQGASETTIYDLKHNKELMTISSPQTESIWFSDWSPDGDNFMTLGTAGEVNVWHFNKIRQRLTEIGLNWKD